MKRLLGSYARLLCLLGLLLCRVSAGVVTRFWSKLDRVNGVVSLLPFVGVVLAISALYYPSGSSSSIDDAPLGCILEKKKFCYLNQTFVAQKG